MEPISDRTERDDAGVQLLELAEDLAMCLSRVDRDWPRIRELSIRIGQLGGMLGPGRNPDAWRYQ